MPITTITQAKTILGVNNSETAKIAQITAFIPMVEADYLRIRNKPFDIGNALTITLATAVAVAGDITITLDDTEYEVAVVVGDTAQSIAYKIKVTLESASYYTVQVIGVTVYFKNRTESAALTLAFTDTDGTGVTATVSGPGTIYPEGAELTAIKMIQYQLGAGMMGAGISSEKLSSDYAVSFDTSPENMLHGYPKSVVGGIRRYARSM